MRVDLDALDKKYEHELYVMPVPIPVVKELSKELRAARSVISAVKILDMFLHGFLSGEDSLEDLENHALRLLKNELENYTSLVGDTYTFKSTGFKKQNPNTAEESKDGEKNTEIKEEKKLTADYSDMYDDDWY